MKKIYNFIKQNCWADDFSICISQQSSHQTRFAQNQITQHIAGDNISIYLWVAIGNKTGSGVTNQADEYSLKKLIDDACTVAKYNVDDPEFMPSATKCELPKVNNYDENIKNLSSAQMVDIVKKCCDFAKAKQAKIAGMTEKHIFTGYIFTKNGFETQNTISSFGNSMTIKKGSIETKVDTELKNLSAFNLGSQISQLESQFDALSNPQNFDACKIPVILMPNAVQGLIGMLGYKLDKRQIDEGFSPFSDKLNTNCFGEKFNLISTLNNDNLISNPNNNEFIANKNTTWVKDGVLQNVPCTRYWAKKTNYTPQSFFNFYVPGEENTINQLMQKVDRGLLVNRFWYIRFVDNKTGELTGMTRDGVIYFENGKFKHAVNNLRWNEIPQNATKRIIALGKNQPNNTYYDLPPMLINDFNFVDSTRF